MFPQRENGTRVDVCMFPWNENRNDGAFAKTTLCETALLSPGDLGVAMEFHQQR